MDIMPQALELTGQIIDINPLPAAVHITAVGEEAYSHKHPPGINLSVVRNMARRKPRDLCSAGRPVAETEA
jgi:hypothetical protein